MDRTLEKMLTDLQSKHLNSDLEKTSKDSDKCPLCNGLGFVPVIDDEGNERYAPCECYKREQMKNRLKFANIPDAFKDVSLKDIKLGVYQKPDSRDKVKIACKAIKIYLDKFQEMQTRGMGLYIYSRTKGSGKTFVTAAIANELLKSHQVKFAGSTTILAEIKATYGNRTDKDAYTENKLLDDLVNTEILVIDDFGTEKVTDWVNDKFYHIINERYLNKKVTLFTSNESIKTLDYDGRITNRIMEMVYEISFAEESIREHIADANNQELIDLLNGKGGGVE